MTNVPMPDTPTWSKPDPDPTLLTTAQLLREIANATAILRAEMSVTQEQINGDRQVAAVRAKAMEEQFSAIEAWRKEQKLDTKTAVDAALQAAEKGRIEQTVASEKAMTKSETAASEQSKQQYATFNASLAGVSTTVNDLKDRVVKIESVKIGQAETRQGSAQSNALIFGIIGAFVGIAGLIIVIVTLLITSKP